MQCGNVCCLPSSSIAQKLKHTHYIHSSFFICWINCCLCRIKCRVFIDYKKQINITEPQVIITYEFFQRKRKKIVCFFFVIRLFSLDEGIWDIWLPLIADVRAPIMLKCYYYSYFCFNENNHQRLLFNCEKQPNKQINNIAQNKRWTNRQMDDIELINIWKHFSLVINRLDESKIRIIQHLSFHFDVLCCFLLFNFFSSFKDSRIEICDMWLSFDSIWFRQNEWMFWILILIDGAYANIFSYLIQNWFCVFQ